jgi:phage terminase small subunit
VPSAKADLTPKERAFVTSYLVDGNGTQAAIRAGYAKQSAHVTASQLLRKPKIAAAIAQAQTKVEAATIADATERREILSAMLRNPDHNESARVKAADVLNKMDGLYLPKGIPLTVPLFMIPAGAMPDVSGRKD